MKTQSEPASQADRVPKWLGASSVAALAYLECVYSDAGQKLVAGDFCRPVRSEAADSSDVARFPKLELVTIDVAFGGWAKSLKPDSAHGGVFDQISTGR